MVCCVYPTIWASITSFLDGSQTFLTRLTSSSLESLPGSGTGIGIEHQWSTSTSTRSAGSRNLIALPCQRRYNNRSCAIWLRYFVIFLVSQSVSKFILLFSLISFELVRSSPQDINYYYYYDNRGGPLGVWVMHDSFARTTREFIN